MAAFRLTSTRQCSEIGAEPKHAFLDDHSFWLCYGKKDYNCLIQRPDGSYIMGRANTGRRAAADDSKFNLVPHAHLRAVTPQLFDFGTKDLQVTHAWSGAVAFTEEYPRSMLLTPQRLRTMQRLTGSKL